MDAFASIFKLFLHTHALDLSTENTGAFAGGSMDSGTLALISLFPMITFRILTR
jgi:hypothetical protein